MAKEITEQDKRENLRKIINDSRTGMLVTRRADGTMHGRPMANAEVEENFSHLWFATQRSSPKIDELQTDDRAFIGYTNSSGAEWAAVNGRARAVDDRAKIKELWSPFWKNWFKGPDDPELILLEFTPESAEYWDSGNKIVGMFKFAMGAVIGKNLLEDDNEKLTLK